MPPRRKKRHRLQDTGSNAAHHISAKVSQQIKEQLTTDDVTADLNASKINDILIANFISGAHQFYYGPNSPNQSELQIKEEAVEVAAGNRSGTDNHDLISSPRAQWDCTSNQQRLPDNVVKSILRHYKGWGLRTGQALLSSRLVCVQWNRIIEDTPDLMKKIRFPVWHPIPFIQLPLVKKGKVKSIVFKNSFPSSYAAKLIKVIGSTVEDIEFEFMDQSSKNRQRQLFVRILQGCQNLKEIYIDGTKHCVEFLSQPVQKNGFSVSMGFMEQKIELSPIDNIRIISLEMAEFDKKIANGLIQLLLLLPKLEEIGLWDCCSDQEYYTNILTGLCKYIEKYKSELHLKSLTLHPNGSDVVEDEHLELFVSLLILCAKHQINFTEVPHIDINNFLALNLPALQHCPLLTTKVYGELTLFGDEPLMNLDRLNYLNFRKLELIFKRRIENEDISWIRDKREFKSLALIYDPEINTDKPPSIAELELIFSEGFPALKWLKVTNGINEFVEFVGHNIFQTYKP